MIEIYLLSLAETDLWGRSEENLEAGTDGTGVSAYLGRCVLTLHASHCEAKHANRCNRSRERRTTLQTVVHFSHCGADRDSYMEFISAQI